jgi:D-glycero-alpha-D-manno-heptose-7-phosphate kinase
VIISRTPFRISFFGGGSDYPRWFSQHGGAVLSTSIDKYCYISCRRLPPFFDYRHRFVYSRSETVQEISQIQHPAIRAVLEQLGWHDGLEIHHDGDLPARSGLGTSSSFTVGLLNALYAMRGQYVSKENLAARAIDIEQNIIRENVGSQDQVAAAYGGFNRIEFRRDGGFDPVPVIIPQERLEALQSHLMLVFTGFSRTASDIAKAKIENLDVRAAEIRRLTKMVDEGIEILSSTRPIEEFGSLLHEAWMVKRNVADGVSNREIDAIYSAARESGAIGGKLLGAGAGGFMVFFARPASHSIIQERLKNLVQVPFRFENSGSRIVLYQPNGL